jgi:hypothetical protein
VLRKPHVGQLAGNLNSLGSATANPVLNYNGRGHWWRLICGNAIGAWEFIFQSGDGWTDMAKPVVGVRSLDWGKAICARAVFDGATTLGEGHDNARARRQRANFSRNKSRNHAARKERQTGAPRCRN